MISTTESVSEAGEWRLHRSSETSLIFQLGPRSKYGFQIHCNRNFSSDFASKIPQDQVVYWWQNEGADEVARELKRPNILLMIRSLNSNSH